jgi:nucleoside-diphosphate-sugar epimerase
MKVLIVGGAGNVATWTMPYMSQRHDFRVLDIGVPRVENVEYVRGSTTDPDALDEALDGVDAFINMVMKSPTDSKSPRHSIQDTPGFTPARLPFMIGIGPGIPRKRKCRSTARAYTG